MEYGDKMIGPGVFEHQKHRDYIEIVRHFNNSGSAG
jgi:hypothetical protein